MHMKKLTKVFTLITLLAILIIPMGVQADSLSRQTLISVDGKPVQFTEDLGFPTNNGKGRTLVPVRIISENMGYKVEWENKDQKVTISDDKTTIIFNVGDSTALVNGERVPMDVREDSNGNKVAVDTKAQIIGTRTYVPLRFVSEAMGRTVDWKIEGSTLYIYITKGEIEIPEVGTIPGVAEYDGEGHEKRNVQKIKDFFGESTDTNIGGVKENGGLISFNPIGGGTDGSFLYVIDREGEDFEALVVIKNWFMNDLIGSPSEKEYRMINSTAKEVLRFYLPDGYEKLYNIIDDGYNFRWDDASKYVNKDISNLIGSDKSVKLIDADGLQIRIGE